MCFPGPRPFSPYVADWVFLSSQALGLAVRERNLLRGWTALVDWLTAAAALYAGGGGGSSGGPDVCFARCPPLHALQRSLYAVATGPLFADAALAPDARAARALQLLRWPPGLVARAVYPRLTVYPHAAGKAGPPLALTAAALPDTVRWRVWVAWRGPVGWSEPTPLPALPGLGRGVAGGRRRRGRAVPPPGRVPRRWRVCTAAPLAPGRGRGRAARPSPRTAPSAMATWPRRLTIWVRVPAPPFSCRLPCT